MPPAGVSITPNDTLLLKRGLEEDGDTAIPHKPAAAAGENTEDLKTRQQNGAALAGKKARSAKIAEADIDWDTTQSCPVASQGPKSSGGDALVSVSAAGAAVVSESASAPVHPAAADSKEHVANNVHRNVKATVTKGDWADEAHEAVTRGVRAFVMAILDPLYAASVIDGKVCVPQRSCLPHISTLALLLQLGNSPAHQNMWAIPCFYIRFLYHTCFFSINLRCTMNKLYMLHLT